MKWLNFAVFLSGEHFQPCQGSIQWKQHVPQICWYLSSRPQGIESQETVTLTNLFMETKRFVLFHSVWKKLFSILDQYVVYRADKFSLFSSGALIKRGNTPLSIPSKHLPTNCMLGFTTRGKFPEMFLYICVSKYNLLTLCIFSGCVGVGMK
jgi:hypothetical protein